MPYLVEFDVVAFMVQFITKCYCGNVQYSFCDEMNGHFATEISVSVVIVDI